MRPIDEKVDVNFIQALKCVAFRLPDSSSLKKSGYTHALGLRYGLIGAAAAHELLTTCDFDDEAEILTLVHAWPLMVEEHARLVVAPSLRFQPTQEFAANVGRLGYDALQSYLSLYRRLCPLDRALAIVRDGFVQLHESSASEGWALWHRSKARRQFRTTADESLRFALCFYERREADLEELPEIALIGE